MVRKWQPYGAGGDSATPTRARPAGRRLLSARRIDRLGQVLPRRGVHQQQSQAFEDQELSIGAAVGVVMLPPPSRVAESSPRR